MLIDNPKRQKLDDRTSQIMDNVADYERDPEYRRLIKKLQRMPNHKYVDEGGQHHAAAQMLLEHADRQERVWVKQVDRENAHALPVAYLMAAKIYEERQQPKTLSGGKALTVQRGKQAVSKKAMLETILTRGKIRGHNDPMRDFTADTHSESLSYAVSDKERAILDGLEDSHESRAVTLEALGQLCVEELQHRGILTQQGDGKPANYTFRNMVSGPVKKFLGHTKTQTRE